MTNDAAGHLPGAEREPEQYPSAWIERLVLIYQSPPTARSKIPQIFPAPNAYADEFRAGHPGALLMIGPFPEPEAGEPGAMSIWTNHEAAEQFPLHPIRLSSAGSSSGGTSAAGSSQRKVKPLARVIKRLTVCS